MISTRINSHLLVESGITDNLFTVALYRICRLIFRIIVQELMQLNDVGFQITRYYHTSLGTERDRILLKRNPVVSPRL